MKSHPRSRLFVSMARKVDAVRPRNERDISTDEFEVITRRQAMKVLERADRDHLPRDWRLVTAAICIGVSLVGLVLGTVLAAVWP